MTTHMSAYLFLPPRPRERDQPLCKFGVRVALLVAVAKATVHTGPERPGVAGVHLNGVEANRWHLSFGERPKASVGTSHPPGAASGGSGRRQRSRHGNEDTKYFAVGASVSVNVGGVGRPPCGATTHGYAASKQWWGTVQRVLSLPVQAMANVYDFV